MVSPAPRGTENERIECPGTMPSLCSLDPASRKILLSREVWLVIAMMTSATMYLAARGAGGFSRAQAITEHAKSFITSVLRSKQRISMFPGGSG